MTTDRITSPAHYTFSGIEPREVIAAWGLNFSLGNVVSADHKGAALDDLRKAREYLDFEIKRRELDGNGDAEVRHD
jgi:hypothetical protein